MKLVYLDIVRYGQNGLCVPLNREHIHCTSRLDGSNYCLASTYSHFSLWPEFHNFGCTYATGGFFSKIIMFPSFLPHAFVSIKIEARYRRVYTKRVYGTVRTNIQLNNGLLKQRKKNQISSFSPLGETLKLFDCEVQLQLK